MRLCKNQQLQNKRQERELCTEVCKKAWAKICSFKLVIRFL